MKCLQTELDQYIKANGSQDMNAVWKTVKKLTNDKLDDSLASKLSIVYTCLESAVHDICPDQISSKRDIDLAVKLLTAIRVLSNCEGEAKRALEIPPDIFEKLQDIAEKIENDNDIE